MGWTFAAFFVRTSDLARASRLLGPAEPVAGSAWAVCGHSRSAGPPADDVLEGRRDLTSLSSAELREVIYLYGDSSAGAFVYEHAVGGTLVRKLVWFPMLDDDWTPGWICVQGQPERWEAALWPDVTLRPGTTEPEGDATLALRVEKHFGLVRPG